QQRMVRRSTFDPPRRLPQLRKRTFRAAEQLVEPGQRFSSLQARLHRRTLFGEARFFAFLGRESLDLAARMFEPFAVALRRRRFRPRIAELRLDADDLGPGPRGGTGVQFAE